MRMQHLYMAFHELVHPITRLLSDIQLGHDQRDYLMAKVDLMKFKLSDLEADSLSFLKDITEAHGLEAYLFLRIAIAFLRLLLKAIPLSDLFTVEPTVTVMASESRYLTQDLMEIFNPISHLQVLFKQRSTIFPRDFIDRWLVTAAFPLPFSLAGGTILNALPATRQDFPALVRIIQTALQPEIYED